MKSPKYMTKAELIGELELARDQRADETLNFVRATAQRDTAWTALAEMRRQAKFWERAWFITVVVAIVANVIRAVWFS